MFFKIICTIFLFPIAVWAKYELAIVAIFQNEAGYLKEWIEFHKLQGVEHFYLYDNCSEDNPKWLLEPYITAGEVTLIPWNYKYPHGNTKAWNNIQCGAYKHCMRTYGSQCTWIAALDSDEYLFCTNGEKLPSFLRDYVEFAALGVNWLVFGTSHVWDVPPDFLMIQVLTCCAETNNPINLHIKSIVQPKYVSFFDLPHCARYNKRGKYAVDVSKKYVSGPYTESVQVDKIRINHYWPRTEKFFLEYKIPRAAKMWTPELSEAYKQDRIKYSIPFNASIDTSIQQFVPELRKNMGLTP